MLCIFREKKTVYVERYLNQKINLNLAVIRKSVWPLGSVARTSIFII